MATQAASGPEYDPFCNDDMTDILLMLGPRARRAELARRAASVGAR